jgi:S1-C subfamily serine protease
VAAPEAAPASASQGGLSPLWALPLTAAIIVFGLFAWKSAAPLPPAQPPVAIAPPASSLPPDTPGAGRAPAAVAAPLPDLSPVPPPVTRAPATWSIAEVVGRAAPAVVTVQTNAGTGSGFFIAQDAVITNNHVVGQATRVTLHLVDGGQLEGRVTETAPQVDLAVVRVARSDRVRPVLEVKPVSSVRVGEEVLAIGSPGFGGRALDATVTRGIVSGVRDINGVTIVQTDAALNPGNSGGPVLDTEGRVLAVATAKARGSESIGFAVAAEYALALLAGRGSSPVQALVRPGTEGGLDQGQAAGPTESDAARAQALRGFDGQMAALGRQAAQFARMVERFRDKCVNEQVAGPGVRDASWQEATAYVEMDRAIAVECLGGREQIRSLRRDVSAALEAAEEQARRDGLYPGEIREIRRRHGLDWDGWTR